MSGASAATSCSINPRRSAVGKSREALARLVAGVLSGLIVDVSVLREPAHCTGEPQFSAGSAFEPTRFLLVKLHGSGPAALASAGCPAPRNSAAQGGWEHTRSSTRACLLIYRAGARLAVTRASRSLRTRRLRRLGLA